jgi:GTP cyclohydrolase II
MTCDLGIREMARSLSIVATASLPTRFGRFMVHSFRSKGEVIEDIALTCGTVRGREAIATRVHSECVTGDALGSLRCDCRDQLEFALDDIGRIGVGILIYLRQDGRGIGTGNKVSAYALQDRGLDTLEANIHLGYDGDLRSYEDAAAMIATLGPKSIRMYTNNLDKISALERNGVRIAERTPIVMCSRPENVAYLTTKRLKFGHLL